MARITLFLLALLPFITRAQALPSIDDKTKNLKKYEGYLNFYWDENSGKIWLEIDKLDSAILYINSLPAGLGSNDIGLDRGLLGDNRVVRFNRTGRKLLMTQPNYDYRALSSDKAERRAVEQSFAQSVLWGFTIEAESNGRVLVDATDFLMRDAMKVASRIRGMRQGNYTLDKTRSAIYLPQSKNFPQNTELETTLTFVNNDGEAGNFVQQVTPSSEAITLRLHHSFVQLPDNNYQARVFDPRSSFISMSYFDYSTPVTEPIDKYFIIRHRLQKKDPSAAKSEAVKPIIYYLDNGTPEPIRSALLEGAQWWNQAFEAAGYINAFQVKILPEEADPMDVRYNMINWVHRSTRGWSYGYSVSDPRTGEIIKGNVTLGSLRVRQDYLIASGLLSPYENGIPADNKMLKMALNRLKQLSAHEIGHTLGLMHNYAASVVNRSSVMDYPPPAATLDANGNIDLSQAYADGIGEWDKLSITWGYQDFPNGTDEKAALNKLLTDADKKGMQFISDRDARAPGGLHPTAHLWDNGSNAIDELKHVMKVREKALSRFGENNIRPGTPMAFLEDALVPIYLFHRYQVEATVKLVGGMDYRYALRGDGQTVTKALSRQEQLSALQAVLTTIEPSALILPERIIKLIPPRPSGYGSSRELFRKRGGMAFDALSPAETAADLPLSFLFNSDRLNRLSGNIAQTNTLALPEVLDLVIGATWKAPRRKGTEGLIQQQTEQLLLTYLLSSGINDNNSFATRSVLSQSLSSLKSYIESKRKTSTDSLYNGHLLLALERMKTPADAKPTLHAIAPPGAPIGCEE
ncbi:zinc-dependent metalloprotease [Terrimonas sp. NA20]|uniref:Zinc-dependent metalloprotease n=1 Tax=Terrimonas ginsenosidimutans TaxID=2908004 RepID=A0ABS9KQ34_9BACT|nr:zinc-dependent metalloprotease [Terrimonas ginsenosidimutans]MCG2614427.1 zinc-dependent metalloprotease [Terrimonas ginsenosidimutans]